MAEIRIQSSQALQTVIDDLRQLRENFFQEGQGINEFAQQMTNHWKGDASTKFQNRWRTEGENINTMLRAVDDYIRALEEIKQDYETMEQTATDIASGQ